MRTVVLDELDALLLLLPQLEVPVDRRRQKELRSIPPALCVSRMCRASSVRAKGIVLRHDAEIDDVAMHEALEVAIRARHMVQIQSFMWED